MTEGHLQRAIACLQQGDFDRARAICEELVRNHPRHPDAWQLLGLMAMHRGDLQGAREALSRSLDAQPGQPATLTNLGVVLRSLGRTEEAVSCYDRALALQPDLPEALSNRANALADSARYHEALDSCERALRLRPHYAEALSNRGNVLRHLGRFEEAVASFDQAIGLQPQFAAALCNRAAALLDLDRPEEALRDCELALQLHPHYPEAHNNRGGALKRLRKFDQALASIDRALQIQAGYAEAHVNRGNLLRELERPEQALAAIDRALQLKPDLVTALCDRAELLMHLGRHEEAVRNLSRAVELAPEHPLAAGHLMHCRLRLCDWTDHAARVAGLMASLERGLPLAAPFWCLALTDSGAAQLACARAFTARQCPPGGPPALPPAGGRRHGKVRIAYVSSDFRNHPVSRLLAGVFEQHDRERFEVFGISLSGDDGSELRRRVISACDRFEDVSRMSDAEAAAAIRRLEVDILIDLNGHTDGMRPGVLARRPAPIQVAYLGFPGTTAAQYNDYIIADRFVIPEPARRFYSERVVHLPGCFQPNDDSRKAGPRQPMRRETGLPEEGMVLGCFSHAAKLTPGLFSVWMRFLHARDDSVLWLVADGNVARQNLRLEARRRGIDPARLVFAPRLPYAEHLARLPLADLALDTFPFNGGSTTSDVLWAGVPVLTCCGEAFASRMTGSLLQALQLPELIACGVEEYERVGLALLREPPRLAALSARLALNLRSGGVFDTARTCRELEAAYIGVCEGHTFV